MFFVYVLRSENHPRFYIGMTSSVGRRLNEHNKGKTNLQEVLSLGNCFSLKSIRRVQARKREVFLKTGSVGLG
jgi:predicted GIY-YIG superfamily endonuclease